MKNTGTANLEPIPTDYDGLLRIYVLRPIHDDIELENAAEIVDRLAVMDERTEDQEDFLAALSILIEAYEKTTLDKWFTRKDPTALLEFLMKEHDMSGSDLGRVLGSRTLGPAILRGDRELSKSNIIALAKHFSVDPGLFLAA